MQSHETLRHRQAQAGSLVTTVHPVIELPERLEGGRYVLREHADPVVGYGYPDLAGALFAGRHRDLAPRRRELHGVRQQVEHDLFQPQFVDPNEGQAARGLVGELDAGLLGMRQDEPDATSYELPDVRDLLVQLEAVGLDLRQIEDVVYEIEQMLAGAEDVLSVVLVPDADRTHHRVPDDLRETYDGVQGRPQLVAHVGKEQALAPARRFRLLLGRLEQDLAVLHRGDVGTDDDGAAVLGGAAGEAEPTPVSKAQLSGRPSKRRTNHGRQLGTGDETVGKLRKERRHPRVAEQDVVLAIDQDHRLGRAVYRAD